MSVFHSVLEEENLPLTTSRFPQITYMKYFYTTVFVHAVFLKLYRKLKKEVVRTSAQVPPPPSDGAQINNTLNTNLYIML